MAARDHRSVSERPRSWGSTELVRWATARYTRLSQGRPVAVRGRVVQRHRTAGLGVHPPAGHRGALTLRRMGRGDTSGRHIHRSLRRHLVAGRASPNGANPDLYAWQLNAAAGDSGSDVWAVGDGSNGDGSGTLIEHWDGTSWSVVPSPNVDDRNSLTGVAVIDATHAWSVGKAEDYTYSTNT